MTFVFPVLLGGLIIAGVPILLHLIMRQKPKTLAFPAFRFLVQRQRTNLRKLQLRHLLLLALRVLLIVLACLALGRPRLFNQGLNLSSEHPVAAVLVFDTSLSMEYKTSANQSRLDDAKKRGQEFLNELPSGSRVVILDTADPAGSNRGDWLVSMSQARDRIKALDPRPTSVSVLQTLEYAYRILAELALSHEDETGRHLPRFLCVFSDRTRACWDLSKIAAAQTAAAGVPPSLEGLQQIRDDIAPLVGLLKELRGQLPPGPGVDYPEQTLIDSLEQLAPRLATLTKSDFPPDEKLMAMAENIQRRGQDLMNLVQPNDQDKSKDTDSFRSKLIVKLQNVLRGVRGAQGLFIDVGIDRPVDLAITHLDLPVQPDGQPRQVFGPEEKILLRAILQATGRDFSTALTATLDGKAYQHMAVDVPAGQRQTVLIEIDSENLKLSPGQHQVEVLIDPTDLLPFNNRRYVTFAIRPQRRVLVLTKDAAQAKYFISALQAIPPSPGFAVDVRSPGDLPDPRRYQAIYLFEVPAPISELWSYLLDAARQGIGSGIVPGGAEMDLGAYNLPAAQKVMPAALGRIIDHGKDDGTGKNPGAVWNFGDDSVYQHPFMRPFRNWQENDLVRFPSEAFSFWEAVPQNKETVELVFYTDAKHKLKLPALLERQLPSDNGKPGKILLFTTPLDGRTPRWNNYLETVRNSMYVVLVGLATSYLAGESETPRLNFLAGQDEPMVTIPPSARHPAYTLKGPSLLPQIAAPERRSELPLREAQAPGNYVLLANDAGDNQRVAAFSVNVPPEESDLSRVPAREIEKLFGPDAVIPVDRQAAIRDVLKGHWSEPVELFPLFMLIVLVILVVENLLANKFYRSAS